MIRIHTKKRSIKKTVSEFAWDNKVLNRVYCAASKLSYAELVLFWLKEKTRDASEKKTKQWMLDLAKFSKQELVDIIHEVGPEAGKQLLKR